MVDTQFFIIWGLGLGFSFTLYYETPYYENSVSTNLGLQLTILEGQFSLMLLFLVHVSCFT